VRATVNHHHDVARNIMILSLGVQLDLPPVLGPKGASYAIACPDPGPCRFGTDGRSHSYGRRGVRGPIFVRGLAARGHRRFKLSLAANRLPGL
jgi:hypothetical protein